MRKLGTLDPVVYFENSAGVIVLAPSTADARYFYEWEDRWGRSYKNTGFELREAGTLQEVDALQDRLQAQERAKLEAAAEKDEVLYRARARGVADSLRARMVSSSTSPYEREFIELYLQLREEKRAKHRQRFLETTSYLWAREMDEHTLPQDRIKG
jgi:hypothetical protein